MIFLFLDSESVKGLNLTLTFRRIKITPENYTLYKIAKSIYTESGEVGVDELADPELVSTEVFHLVINAMLIYRYGLSALRLKREDGGYGCMSS
ncbi:hypothetical protein MR810_05685 [bacterium]|nr:hypothetical protein [bacterium]